MNYIQYSFTVTPAEPGSDILIALLADLGFESFTQNDTGVDAYIQEEFENEATTVKSCLISQATEFQLSSISCSSFGDKYLMSKNGDLDDAHQK